MEWGFNRADCKQCLLLRQSGLFVQTVDFATHSPGQFAFEVTFPSMSRQLRLLPTVNQSTFSCSNAVIAKGDQW